MCENKVKGPAFPPDSDSRNEFELRRKDVTRASGGEASRQRLRHEGRHETEPEETQQKLNHTDQERRRCGHLAGKEQMGRD